MQANYSYFQCNNVVTKISGFLFSRVIERNEMKWHEMG